MKKHIAQILLIAGLFLVSFSLLTQGVSAHPSAQSDLVARGKYIVSVAGCEDCHTTSLPEYLDFQNLSLEQIQTIAFNAEATRDTSKLLAGGRAFDLGPAGLVFTKNLTPDKETGLGNWTDQEIKNAIRNGARPDGTVLFPVMPYFSYHNMADADVDAVVAYLRSVPAVKNQVPPRTVSTEGMQSLPAFDGIKAPDASDKAARGEYLVRVIGSCTDCHTPIDPASGAPQMDKFLAGGQPYAGPWGVVYGGNITPDKETGLGDWSEVELKRALISGVRKDGRKLILMPWFVYANFTANDADAVVYYLKNVLPAVSNEVPAAAPADGFVIMDTSSAASGVNMNLIYIGVGVVLIFGALAYFLSRRKTA